METNRITDQITIDEGQTVVSDDEDGSEADIGDVPNLDSISYPPELVQSALNMLNYMKAEKKSHSQRQNGLDLLITKNFQSH